jgi:hypothetical protein
MRAAVLLLATLAAPALAGAPPEVVVVPPAPSAEWKTLAVPAGVLVELKAQPASTWDVVTDGLQIRVLDGGSGAVVVVPAGEKFRVKVTGPDKSVSQYELVGGTGPKPPPPSDPLKARLAAAFAADPAPASEKHGHAKDLAELYRQAAKLSASADVATAGDLLARVKAAAVTLVGADALKGVRSEAGKELGLLFPADGPLSPEQRTRAAELFGRLATILDQLGA